MGLCLGLLAMRMYRARVARILTTRRSMLSQSDVAMTIPHVEDTKRAAVVAGMSPPRNASRTTKTAKLAKATPTRIPTVLPVVRIARTLLDHDECLAGTRSRCFCAASASASGCISVLSIVERAQLRYRRVWNKNQNIDNQTTMPCHDVFPES